MNLDVVYSKREDDARYYSSELARHVLADGLVAHGAMGAHARPAVCRAAGLYWLSRALPVHLAGRLGMSAAEPGSNEQHCAGEPSGSPGAGQNSVRPGNHVVVRVGSLLHGLTPLSAYGLGFSARWIRAWRLPKRSGFHLRIPVLLCFQILYHSIAWWRRCALRCLRLGEWNLDLGSLGWPCCCCALKRSSGEHSWPAHTRSAAKDCSGSAF